MDIVVMLVAGFLIFIACLICITLLFVGLGLLFSQNYLGSFFMLGGGVAILYLLVQIFRE